MGKYHRRSKNKTIRTDYEKGKGSMQRVILLDGDYWKVLEYSDRWELCKYAVSISYYKLNRAETYSQFTDRLMAIHQEIENKHGK